jgi:hypothetical protein
VRNVAMKNEKRYKLYAALFLFIYIIRIVALNNDYIVSGQNIGSVHHINFAYTVHHDNSNIDFNQQNRKIWVYRNNTVAFNHIKVRYALTTLLLCYIILYIVIVICNKIKELNTIRFNGSKYKGGCLLPEL